MALSNTWREALEQGVWLIGARGRLDHNLVPHLESTLTQSIDAGNFHLVVDLGQVTYINSGGLRALVVGWRAVRKQGGDLYLCRLTSRLREIFEMVGFYRIFAVYPTPADAARAMIESWSD